MDVGIYEDFIFYELELELELEFDELFFWLDELFLVDLNFVDISFDFSFSDVIYEIVE